MPKGLTLDKSKPFGEICGCLQGRRYEQGGNVFDANGELFEAAKPKKPPTAAEKALALGAGPDQLSAQLEG